MTKSQTLSCPYWRVWARLSMRLSACTRYCYNLFSSWSTPAVFYVQQLQGNLQQRTATRHHLKITLKNCSGGSGYKLERQESQQHAPKFNSPGDFREKETKAQGDFIGNQTNQDNKSSTLIHELGFSSEKHAHSSGQNSNCVAF